MGYSTLAQMILILISIIVVFVYVTPEFESIQSVRAEVTDFQEAVNNANQFNERFESLNAERLRIEANYRSALDDFLPQDRDAIAFMRDMQLLAEREGMSVMSLSVEESENQAEVTEIVGGGDDAGGLNIALIPIRVAIELEGTYSQLKRYLSELERNAYLLEVTSLSFDASDTGLYTFSLDIETYESGAVNDEEI